jgi:hypothetical protein
VQLQPAAEYVDGFAETLLRGNGTVVVRRGERSFRRSSHKKRWLRSKDTSRMLCISINFSEQQVQVPFEQKEVVGVGGTKFHQR